MKKEIIKKLENVFLLCFLLFSLLSCRVTEEPFEEEICVVNFNSQNGGGS